MNEFLSAAELNTVFNLPIVATRMRICKDMSQQLHLEVTGKSAITNLMQQLCHTVVSFHDPCSAVNFVENWHLIQFFSFSFPSSKGKAQSGCECRE
jgi:hypothetical protein